MDCLLEDSERGPALGGGGEAGAVALLGSVLLPPLVWRAGKTAAAVRFAAITALSTMLTAGLAPAGALNKVWGEGGAGKQVGGQHSKHPPITRRGGFTCR